VPVETPAARAMVRTVTPPAGATAAAAVLSGVSGRSDFKAGSISFSDSSLARRRRAGQSPACSLAIVY